MEIQTNFGRKSNSAGKLMDYLFQKPVVNVNQVKVATGLSYKAANDLVNDFMRIGLLNEMTGQNRNRVFVFDEYLKLF